MLTDTHAHLDFPQLSADLPAVIERARAAGVTRIVSIGTGVASSRRTVAIAAENDGVFAAVGVHPNHVAEEVPDFSAALRELAEMPRVVAIGETGLDYHWLPSTRGGSVEDDSRSKAAQAAAFRAQLDLAAARGLPVVIHERDAWEDTLAILREYTGRVRCVMHCFGKSTAHAAEAVALGHIVSFTGIVTFRNGQTVKETAASIAESAFMIETDCPYLAPVPYRGKPCEPAHVRDTAACIAALRGVTLEALAAQTSATAADFFRLSA